jgi:acyl dehydratase
MNPPSASTLLYLDELSAGQHFSSASLTVTAEAIKAFAREFDPQPFHISEASAERTFFGSLAASGWHTAALTMRLNV